MILRKKQLNVTFMSKHYFDSELFIKITLESCNFDLGRAEIKQKLHDMVERRLVECIYSTVIQEMSKQNIHLFHKILEDHPELDEMDALMMIAPNISGLGEKLERAIQSLYREIVLEAKELQES